MLLIVVLLLDGWAGLAEGKEVNGTQVVGALQSSGLEGPAGGLSFDVLCFG